MRRLTCNKAGSQIRAGVTGRKEREETQRLPRLTGRSRGVNRLFLKRERVAIVRIQRLAIALTVLNLALLVFLVVQNRRAEAQSIAPVLRGRELKIVDDQARTASREHRVSPQAPRKTVECAVTTPNGIAAGVEQPAPGSYGNREVSVGPFGLWPDGTVVFKPGGSGFVTRNGSLGMKFGWPHGVSGQIRITGCRLDAEAPPLRAEVPDGSEIAVSRRPALFFQRQGVGKLRDASATPASHL